MKITRYILLMLAGITAFSCDESLSELNEDPNLSSSANATAVFTAATGYYGIALEAYFNEYDALLAQYWAGGPGVALIDQEKYHIEASDFNTEWDYSLSQALSDLSFVMSDGNAGLAAAADILSVLIWQNLVDHFGDIPYSEALRAAPDEGGILAPVYDDAKTVYDDLVTRLDGDIAVLKGVSVDDALIGEEDLIYEGDLDSWIRLAYSLKLKILMRQSMADPSGVSAQVIALIGEGDFIETAAQMAMIPFEGSEGSNYNPQYARRTAGVGQFYVASETSVDVMSSMNDPRLSVLYDEAAGPGGIVGLKQGNVEALIAPSKDDFSFPSAVAYGEANPVILMSHWEVMFLRAEAALRFGTGDSEKTMFEAAVTAHFDYIGAEGAADYLANDIEYSEAASQQSRSDAIGIQKWISMNGLQESEGWIESRRFDMEPTSIFTGDIFVTPTESELGDGVFPSIHLYPQSELSFNPNTPTGGKITDKVFWDN